MWETYDNYIIAYVIIGFIHFLWRYGVNIRKIVKYNSMSYNTNYCINWGNLIFMQGFFWPFSLILRIVDKIALIGV